MRGMGEEERQGECRRWSAAVAKGHDYKEREERGERKTEEREEIQIQREREEEQKREKD